MDVGIGIVGALAGCGGTDGTQPPEGSEGGGAGGDTLTVWAWDANFNVPIMEKAGQYYTEQVDGAPNVEVVEMANEDVMQRLISGFTSGVSEGLPDIVLMDDYDAQRMLTGYEGKFSELSEHIDMSQFADYKVDLVSHNDGVYVVPFDSGSAGLYYRTDYLEQAGYTQEDMQDLTWSEFVEIGKDVKEATGKWFLVFIPGRGTHYMQMAMPVDYFSPEAVGAVTSGDVAAVNSAIWYSATIRSAEDQSGLWAYTNVPQLETVDNATPYTNLGGASWYVWEDSPNKEAAIELLETQFAGNEEFYQEILVENGAVGTYIPAQGGEAFRSVMQQYMDGEISLDDMIQQAEEYYNMQVGQQ
ncbi:ABC transporter substrate-binding protein [Atopococcus tabaci]|uniref:ABC transporter substrate-binding protein n=1 Tax=Atopococcus tabaci TaxID=269774 RepID=UPI000487A967|nr:extracellular solute-binding protein [Atopococcus tabaci]